MPFFNSKRISDHVQDLLKKAESISNHNQDNTTSPRVNLDAIMISSEYWPPLNMDEAKWHPSMNVLSEEFQEAYGTLVFGAHFFASHPLLEVRRARSESEYLNIVPLNSAI